MHKLTGYLGTYASPRSMGIYGFTVDLEDGSLSRPQLYYEAPDCKYLSVRDGCLASPLKKGTQAGICLLDTGSSTLKLAGEAFHETSPACYVTQDGPEDDLLCTANYHQGSVLVYRKTSHGPKLIKQIQIEPKAGCHQILFHGHFMLVPCLLLDTVKIFDCRNDFSPAGELKFDKGTGPRHGIFDRDHSRLFLVSELSNQVFVFQTNNDSDPSADQCPHMELKSVHPILDKGQQYSQAPASAAIRLSPDQRFLYVSTRFADIISVFRIDGCELTPIQQTGSGGTHPRDIILTPDGSYLLAANRTEGGLVCFPRDAETGRILDICSHVPAPEAVSIAFDGHNM